MVLLYSSIKDPLFVYCHWDHVHLQLGTPLMSLERPLVAGKSVHAGQFLFCGFLPFSASDAGNCV